MKLILASEGKFLRDTDYRYLGIPKEEMRIGYVTTASKGMPSQTYIENNITELRAQGYSVHPVDIEEKTIDELRAFFKTMNVIQVTGGNTFYLLKAFKETGFDTLLKELLDGGMPYAGSSAGSYILGPSIETATWKIQEKDRYGVTDFTALGYVPWMIFSHYTPDMKERIVEKIKTAPYPARILQDGQAIFFEDGKDTFVGEGTEVTHDLYS